jgi:hypothetical protein
MTATKQLVERIETLSASLTAKQLMAFLDIMDEIASLASENRKVEAKKSFVIHNEFGLTH